MSVPIECCRTVTFTDPSRRFRSLTSFECKRDFLQTIRRSVFRQRTDCPKALWYWFKLIEAEVTETALNPVADFHPDHLNNCVRRIRRICTVMKVYRVQFIDQGVFG